MRSILPCVAVVLVLLAGAPAAAAQTTSHRERPGQSSDVRPGWLHVTLALRDPESGAVQTAPLTPLRMRVTRVVRRGEPLRFEMGSDGIVELALQPGEYSFQCDDWLKFGRRHYHWTRAFTITPAATTRLVLTVDNAAVEPASATEVLDRADTPQQASDCVRAGSSVRIDARQAGERIYYTVINNSADRLRFLRIGTGRDQRPTLASGETPMPAGQPGEWHAEAVRSSESDRVYVSWETTSPEAELTPYSRTGFAIRVRAAGGVTQPIDLGSLPFTVGAASGSCWSGTTNNRSAVPEGGYFAGARGATVRAIPLSRARHVLVDAPLLEEDLRLGGKPVFLTIPVGLTWGVNAGFSHEAFIGVGVKWSPSKYVTTSAETRVGTFLLNNRTHLRSVGIDVNVPIARETFSTGYSRQSKYIVVGAEYYRRDAVKWMGFMKGPQWYASGHGVAFRLTLRRLGWSLGA